MVLNMDIWIENNKQDLLVSGTLDFIEGEVNAQKEPVFYVLATDKKGDEFRIFFKSKHVSEHKEFIKHVEEVLRH